MIRALFQLLMIACVFGQNKLSIDSIKITAAEIREHIRFLASDKLKGRYPGTSGAKIAIRYIEKEWKKSGVLPAGDRRFKQTFNFTDGVSLFGYNRLKINETKQTFRVKKDFIPIGFSGTGKFNAPVVFAGYGFSVDDSISWNDYSDTDVNGKWVLVFRGSPDGSNPHSSYADYMPLRKKYLTARDNGALGILFVNRYDDEDKDGLIPLTFSRSSGGEKIAALHISKALAENLLPEELSLNGLQHRLDENKTSASFTLPFSLSVNIGLKEKMVTGVNLVGYIPGDGSSDEFVVIGAHTDHLGLGGKNSGSLRPYEHAIHNGADDNASGIAGLLELAEKFSGNSDALKRGLVFITFDAEEKGIIGSKYFVENPTVDLRNIVAMLNLDMIGRMKDSSLSVGGTGTSPIFEPMLDSLQKIHKLKISYNQGGYGPSDHSSFYTKDSPVLFFFTGAHEDYHKPSDDWEKINTSGEKQILDLVYDVILVLSNRGERPPFTMAGSKAPSPGKRRFNVTFGVIPSYTSPGPGLTIDGVRPDGPASKAGMMPGDIIVEIGGKEVQDIYDYMYRLEELKKGQIVEVKVNRGEKKLVLFVNL
ncbi:MAG: M20/M25/M40 family metallo-hydrolase [Candidatus Marinimicrobia bacterium]|nr:M20/M25/M40 family metallo-hydrolase [Candidatus Neomarinimicrobiota bacterium]